MCNICFFVRKVHIFSVHYPQILMNSTLLALTAMEFLMQEAADFLGIKERL